MCRAEHCLRFNSNLEQNWVFSFWEQVAKYFHSLKKTILQINHFENQSVATPLQHCLKIKILHETSAELFSIKLYKRRFDKMWNNSNAFEILEKFDELTSQIWKNCNVLFAVVRRRWRALLFKILFQTRKMFVFTLDEILDWQWQLRCLRLVEQLQVRQPERYRDSPKMFPSTVWRSLIKIIRWISQVNQELI